MRYSWAELSEGLTDCRNCRLCEGRNNIVPGEGNPNAQLMFIGEGRVRRRTGWAGLLWAAPASC